VKATVVGGGLAGCEAAWQLARRGVRVRLHEMKPGRRTPAQTGDGLAELVCSNSLRGAAWTNAVGCLKEEMRRAGSLVVDCADLTRVPAGGALAVDREAFSTEITARIRAHPAIEVVPGEVTRIPSERPTLLCTGPLTSDALAADLAAAVGAEHLAYYDAIAPIVDAQTIDRGRVFAASRWGKGEGDEYLNCPFDEAGYLAFVRAILEAEKVEPRAFEVPRYFEGCLPVEVLAARGARTLAFGPMKPVGLVDPRTGRRPYAVVQLRPEDRARTAYNLVGFQTRMKHGEQVRVLRTIPGLERAEFMRLGSVHRNTFLDAPRVLSERFELRALADVHAVGQIAGVEGYVESAACGLLAGVFVAARLAGGEAPLPPRTTTLGGLCEHLRRPAASFQPSNVTWAHVAPLEDPRVRKPERFERLAERALADVDAWIASLTPAAQRAAQHGDPADVAEPAIALGAE
jgi:methylenetetrahydrofolate--tRNA-(uracil-5-)-methyltransferase